MSHDEHNRKCAEVLGCEFDPLVCPAKWKSWGEAFINTERWIEITHTSFTRNS